MAPYKLAMLSLDNVSVVHGLKHNLLSISQFCDKGYGVLFDKEMCQVLHKKNGLPALQGVRKGNLFVGDLVSGCKDEFNCFYAKASSDESWLWHKRLSQLNFKTMNSPSHEGTGERTASNGVHTGKDCVRLVRKESQKKLLIRALTHLQLLNHCNYFIWIYLV